MAEKKIGELFGVPIVVDPSLPEGVIRVREHRKGGRNMTSDKEAISFLDKLRGRIARLRSGVYPVSTIEGYTYVCNKGDLDQLERAMMLMRPYCLHPDGIIVHARRILGVNIEIKPGVRAGGHFLDEKGEKIEEQ